MKSRSSEFAEGIAQKSQTRATSMSTDVEEEEAASDFGQSS